MNGNGFWKNIMIAMILVLAVEEIIVIQAKVPKTRRIKKK